MVVHNRNVLALLPLLCACNMSWSIRSGPCVNPKQPSCIDEADQNSRILEVQVYQLKEPIDPTGLIWEDFRDEMGARRALQTALADPNHVDVRSRFTVVQNERRKESLRLIKTSRYLLVVAAGRRQGSHSMSLVRLVPGQLRESLCVSCYNVFTGPSCDQYIAKDQCL